MSLTECQVNTNVIENLPNSPNLDPQQLKRKFDKEATEMKKYINETLTKEADKELNKRVEKITGKGLSTNDFTNELRQRVENSDSSEITKIITVSKISANENYTVPKYVIANNSLSIYFEGEKLIKDENYIEVDSTHIQFKDWTVPIGSKLEIVIKK